MFEINCALSVGNKPFVCIYPHKSMSESSGDQNIDDINIRSVGDLIGSLKRCKGHYSFLIGAGTSKQSGIPTARDLIEEWRRKRFITVHSDTSYEAPSDDVVNGWADSIESEELDNENRRYGYWFEKRYPTRGERRQFIRDMVKDKEPSFGHIVLASMMADEHIPLTLTPNFDDLLYDAFYLFREEKPLMIDHNAIAPQLQLTQERPTIIKLHGDYLYDNLKNTNSETAELEKNMGDALSRSLDEYGLVVIGYGGNDKSIMNVLNSNDIDIPDFGLFWCTLDKNNLSRQTKELLRKPNTFLVEIDGFEELFSNMYSGLDELSLPMPNEIRERARDREQMLMEKVAETKGTDSLELTMQAQEYVSNGEYEAGIEIYTEIIDSLDGEETEISDKIADLVESRAIAHCRAGNPRKAIRDFSKVIEKETTAGDYLNRAEAKMLNGDVEGVKQDIDRAVELGRNKNDPIPLFFNITARMISGEEYSQLEEQLDERVDDQDNVPWEFFTLREGLEKSNFDNDTKEKIIDLIQRLDSHSRLVAEKVKMNLEEGDQKTLHQMADGLDIDS